MEYGKDITLLLQDLNKATGLPLMLKDGPLDEDETAARLRGLLASLQSANTKSAFFLQYVQGLLSEDDIVKGFHRFHVKESTSWVLFLLESLRPYPESTLSILGNLDNAGRDMILPADTSHLILLRQLKALPDDDELRQMALTVVDTLETETMCGFCISFDCACHGTRRLPVCYQNAAAAMRIGSLFSSSQRLYCYRDMGLEKLFYQLPREACISYLEENLGGVDFRNLDAETLSTIQTFFDNGLNIAETARSLFLHRNTLIYRLDKIERLIGLDIRKFQDAVTCRVAMLLAARLNQ